jgi:hypothetical protein
LDSWSSPYRNSIRSLSGNQGFDSVVLPQNHINMSQFLTKGVILTAILGGLMIAVKQFTALVVPETLYLIILGYFGLTYFLFKSLVKAQAKSPARFVSSFMGAIAIKMLATLFFLAAYLYLNEENRVEIAMAVFVVYISYTILLCSTIINEVRD